MDLKLCFVLLAAVCLAQVHGGPVTKATKDLAADNEHAQYAVVKFATELTVFRMRAYSLALEVNHTIKVINRQIIALMQAIAVDAAKIETVKNEMTTRGGTILDNILRIMNYSQTLVDLLNEINNDIVNNPSKLSLDLYMMNSEINNVNLAYDLGKDNVVLSIDIVKLRIDSAIAGREEPEAVEIRALVAEAETILMTEQNLISGAKVTVDAAGEQARAGLQAVIDQQ